MEDMTKYFVYFLVHSVVLSMTILSMMLCYPSISSWVYLEYGNMMLNLVLFRSPGKTPFFLTFDTCRNKRLLNQSNVSHTKCKEILCRCVSVS